MATAEVSCPSSASMYYIECKLNKFCLLDLDGAEKIIVNMNQIATKKLLKNSSIMFKP